MSDQTPKSHRKAKYESFLVLGDKKLACAVLEDGTRVISKGAVFRAFKRTIRGRAKHDPTRVPGMPSFADAQNLKPFIDTELPRVLEPIVYLNKKGVAISGYQAEALPTLCRVYMRAAAAGVLKGHQKENAKVAESLNQVFAKLGIVAWIDEVTGYQYVRDPAALSGLVALYIAEERRQWQKEFRDEFYLHLNRIYGRTPTNLKDRPGCFAHFTNKYIYEPLEEGQVKRELDKVNPIQANGHRKDKQHFHTTADYGILKVRERIEGTLTCMKLATNKRKFESLYARAFPRKGQGYQDDMFNND